MHRKFCGEKRIFQGKVLIEIDFKIFPAKKILWPIAVGN